MKQATQFLLIILFFLQGASGLSIPTLLLLFLFLGSCFINPNSKLRLPDYYILAVLVYGFYFLLGVFNQHPSAHIDMKFQFFGFTFYLGLLNQKRHLDFSNLLFIINSLVFLAYIMLYFGLLPNIWHEATFGRQGRVLGPAITSITLLLFYYLYDSRPFDFRLWVALAMASVYLIMTSNFTNLVMVVILSFLVAVDLRKLLKPVYLFGIFTALILGVLFLRSDYVPPMIETKLEYLTRPWEYGSVQTRLEDLDQALRREDFNVFDKLFGEGFGVGSRIYRENLISPSLSRTLAFQEIDNGFYYLYHRGGWSLLALFIITHIYMVTRLRGFKTKLGFLVIVIFINLLSIHYFTNLFYLFIPFLVLERGWVVQDNFRQRLAQ